MKAIGHGSISSFLTAVLNVGWYGLAFVLTLSGVLFVAGANVAVQIGPDGKPSIEAGPGAKMTIPVSLNLDTPTFSVMAPSLGIHDAQIRVARASLVFPPRRGIFFIANWVMVVGLLAIALWGLGQLRAVFRTLKAGQPFIPANARRIRRIAWAVILGEFARSAIVYFESYYAMTRFSADGLRFDTHLDLNVFALINGLIVLVIAEVFRAGTRLDEEQSLTI